MRSRIQRSLFVLICQIALAVLIVLAGCDQRVTPPPASRVSTAPVTSVPADIPAQQTVSEAADSKPQPAARVEVGSTEHDFGEMNPYQLGEHEFVVRNVGKAPLKLTAERSTCKCTVVELSEEPVPPGGEAKVKLSWQTTKNNRRFEESATLATNDPQRSSLTFRIVGDILVHVGASPPELVVPGVHPGKGASVSTVLTSQVWEEFDIENLDCSLEGYQATLAPATPEQLRKLKAKSGQQVTIRIPASLPQGAFEHWVWFQIVPPEGAGAPKTFELPLRGRVLRRLAVYGAGIDHTGTVSLGVVDSQQGHRRRLVMKVRDPEPELKVDHIGCHPSFLQVHVTSFTTQTNTKGLYYLDIEVPKSSPVGRFQASEAGEINIDFDHPRISKLQLKVDFAVSRHHRGPLSNQQSADQSTDGFFARTNR